LINLIDKYILYLLLDLLHVKIFLFLFFNIIIALLFYM